MEKDLAIDDKIDDYVELSAKVGKNLRMKKDLTFEDGDEIFLECGNPARVKFVGPCDFEDAFSDVKAYVEHEPFGFLETYDLQELEEYFDEI